MIGIKGKISINMLNKSLKNIKLTKKQKNEIKSRQYNNRPNFKKQIPLKIIKEIKKLREEGLSTDEIFDKMSHHEEISYGSIPTY